MENDPAGMLFIAGDVAAGSTVRDTVQLCPPILMLKLAVPELEGVPLRENSKVPGPFAKKAGDSLASKPFTPVDP
jgi:hypothetical protein